MKKILLSALLIVTFGFYVLHRSSSNKETPMVNTSPTNKVAQQPATPATVSSASANPTSTPTSMAPSAAVTQASSYKSGTYTGSVADAFYGPLQVSIVISNGKISDVQFLQYPNDRDTSRQISARSMPVLKSEAIQAQNAKVDIVSGATQTSQAFVQSLQSALDQAKA